MKKKVREYLTSQGIEVPSSQITLNNNRSRENSSNSIVDEFSLRESESTQEYEYEPLELPPIDPITPNDDLKTMIKLVLNTW